MSLSPSLQDLYSRIAPDLLAVEAQIESALRSEEPSVQRMAHHASGQGGKRMRPAMISLVAEAVGERNALHATLGAVVEMIHLATLVHDDVIDGAGLRRQKRTVNALWSSHDAVLLGDIIFARAIHLLASMGDQRSLLSLTRAVSRVCEGEILQNSQRAAVDMEESTYYRIIDQKTAELYAVGCSLAAHLTGASETVSVALDTFGRELGLAFQITDDCLDLLGDESVVGKSLGTDLVGGKMTLPLILFRDRAAPRDRDLLRRIITGERQDAESFASIRKLLVESEACMDAQKRARDHAHAALVAVRAALPGRDLESLEAVASFVLSRAL
jgi:octaprenyl-diphosphate synthase